MKYYINELRLHHLHQLLKQSFMPKLKTTNYKTMEMLKDESYKKLKERKEQNNWNA